MKITKLNIISDIASPISRVPQVYANFWKWGAFLLAIFATCTSLFARIRLYLVRLHSIKHSSSLSLHDHLLQQLDNESESCDNDDDNNLLSDTESDDEGFNSRFACNYDDKNDQTPYKADQDYSVAGGFYSFRDNHGKDDDHEHQGSDIYDISELFTTGKNVVKQWDNLGLGFQDYFTSKLSIYDLCKDEYVSTFFGAKHYIPAKANLSPAIIYLTEMSKSSNGVKVGAYDRRIGVDNPVMYAEWGSSFGKVGSVSYGGVEKVYVKHSGGGGACMVGDMRNFRSIV